MATKIGNGHTLNDDDSITVEKQSQLPYNTYDPGTYVVTLKPRVNEDGSLNTFYQYSYLPFVEQSRDGKDRITQFAPGSALEASLNDSSVITHVGVGGEILRTFPQQNRGTITMNLFSNGDQAKALAAMFFQASNPRMIEHVNESPLGEITVSAATSKSGSEVFVKGFDCWLTKTPTFTISKGVSVATFVFDCAYLFISFGATQHKS